MHMQGGAHDAVAAACDPDRQGSHLVEHPVLLLVRQDDAVGGSGAGGAGGGASTQAHHGHPHEPPEALYALFSALVAANLTEVGKRHGDTVTPSALG